MPRRNRSMLAYVLVLFTAGVEGALPDYVGRSLDKQIVHEDGRTYTTGPGRYVHRIPRERDERTRCMRDRYMDREDDRIIDCVRQR